jgi:CubicO group peptidase (beta-lactamase class C family)
MPRFFFFPLQRIRKFAVALLLLVALRVPCVAQQDTADIRQVLDGRMLPDAEVRTFEHSEALYPSAIVARGKSVRAVPVAERQLHDIHFDSNGRHYDLFDYLAQNRVAGLLVLKDGRIVLEDYELGFDARSRWASFSMAKSVASTLIGVAMQQGLIASLDDPVGKYVPALRGSAYESVSLRNVLRMASGVRWDETYTDPNSDCRKLTDAQLRHVPGASMAYMATLKAAAPQGTVWNYNSGEANIAGAVLEAATHRPLAQYLSETLWSRLGMESDATWWTESPGGMGLSGVGLGATLRDYARFGLFVQNDGVVDGRRLVPAGWFQAAGSPQVIGGRAVDYGYLWWPVPAGDAVHAGAFEAEGIFGQRLYIHRAERLVIVVLSARPKPVSISGVSDNDFFAAVARALR